MTAKEITDTNNPALEFLKEKFKKGEIKDELAEVIWLNIFSVATILQEYDEHQSQLSDAEIEKRACPCLYGDPCHDRCTCIMPFSSSGCHNCCTYGGLEQRTAKAKGLKSRAGQSQWISAHERLPEDGERCMVAHSKYGVIPAKYWNGAFRCVTTSDGILENVTHWQPLPQKP